MLTLVRNLIIALLLVNRCTRWVDACCAVAICRETNHQNGNLVREASWKSRDSDLTRLVLLTDENGRAKENSFKEQKRSTHHRFTKRRT